MKSFFSLLFFLFSILGACSQEKRQLTVDLYPYIPNQDKFYKEIKNDFETTHKDIQLKIILDPDTYYNRAGIGGGIIDDSADVYEVDCVLLQDFIKRNKIQPLALKLKSDLMPGGVIVYQNKELYAIPHWLCSNFLFLNKNDLEIETANTFSDLENIIGANPASNKSLLTDLAGKLTLGELYSGSLRDEYQDEIDIIKHSDTCHIDFHATLNMDRLSNITYSLWSRNSDYHSKGNFYPQQFARQNCRVFVGYSESLYDILTEIKDSCGRSSNCLNPDYIKIKEWVFGNKVFNNTDQIHMGWVDALAIDSRLNGQKLQDAMTFIEYLTSKEAYYIALIPNSEDAPRYLLPAYKQYYFDSNIIKRAPLYQNLYPLAESIRTIIANGFGYNLRDIGAKFNTEILKK